MTGYIKTSINFDRIQKQIDAAKALDAAGKEDNALSVLKDMAKEIVDYKK